MPYNCEDCGILGARMNTLLEIRLCETCAQKSEYKLICKSIALKQYKLSETDLLNNLELKNYQCKNPHWKSGPAMTLFLERDIQQIFLIKYNNIVTNELRINNPQDNISNTVNLVINYLEDTKDRIKQSKFDKILKKHGFELENLPKWVQDKLEETKSGAEFERVLLNYTRFKKLYKILRDEGLKKYIDHPISHDYIYQNMNGDKLIKSNPEQIPNLIKFMLNKKKLLKKAIQEHNLPINDKYKDLYKEYINSTDTSNKLTISNDLSTLVDYIKDKEYRIISLKNELGKFGLEIRTDSVLCSKYLKGDDNLNAEQIANIMDQMIWFFTHTNYSSYSREYDRDQRESRYDYDYEYDYKRNRSYHSYKHKYDSDSDSDSDDREEEKERYNKKKSDYVKKRCLTEWIEKGKKGVIPPSSLNYLIEQLEFELEKEKMLKIAKQKQKEIIFGPETKKNPKPIKNEINCVNPNCCNFASSSCVDSKCGICCDGTNCEIHFYKLKRK